MLTNAYPMGLRVSPASTANTDAKFLDQFSEVAREWGSETHETIVTLTPPGTDGLWTACVVFGPFSATVARYHGPTAVAAVFEELTRVMRARVVMRHGKPVAP